MKEDLATHVKNMLGSINTELENICIKTIFSIKDEHFIPTSKNIPTWRYWLGLNPEKDINKNCFNNDYLTKLKIFLSYFPANSINIESDVCPNIFFGAYDGSGGAKPDKQWLLYSIPENLASDQNTVVFSVISIENADEIYNNCIKIFLDEIFESKNGGISLKDKYMHCTNEDKRKIKVKNLSKAIFNSFNAINDNGAKKCLEKKINSFHKESNKSSEHNFCFNLNPEEFTDELQVSLVRYFIRVIDYYAIFKGYTHFLANAFMIGGHHILTFFILLKLAYESEKETRIGTELYWYNIIEMLNCFENLQSFKARFDNKKENFLFLLENIEAFVKSRWADIVSTYLSELAIYEAPSSSDLNAVLKKGISNVLRINENTDIIIGNGSQCNNAEWDTLDVMLEEGKNEKIYIRKPPYQSNAKSREDIILKRMIESMVKFYKGTIIPNRNNMIKVATVKIKARNYAHNIGHVDEHTTPSKINERINNLYKIITNVYNTTETEIKLNGEQSVALEWIDTMKERLDNYKTVRNEYLADYRLPPKNLMLYREVILPFVENTLLMDSIAASEEIRYNSSEGSNRLKIKTYFNGGELKANYPNAQGIKNSKGTISYPDNFPYLIKHKNKNKPLSEALNDKEIIGNDVEVVMPSEHTFYSILENFIRNSAKHNKNRLTGEDLIISICVDEKNDSGQIDPDFYTVTLFDNVTCVGKEKLLSIARCTRISIIDETGEPIRTNLGIADMRIDAHLLRSDEEPTDELLKSSLEIVIIDKDFNNNSCASNCFKSLNPVLEAEEKGQLNELNKLAQPIDYEENNVTEQGYRFGYRFKLSRSKKICWIGKTYINDDKKKEFEKRGIYLFENFEKFKNLREKSLAAYQFAVLEPEVLEKWNNDLKNIDGNNKKKLENELEEILLRLPFRVLVNFNENYNVEGILKDFIDNRKIRLVEKKIECNANGNDFDFKILELCWQEWLKRWLKINGNQKKPHLILYFESNNKRWNQIKDGYFNFTQLNNNSVGIKVNNNEVCILFDQHGEGLERIKDKNNAYISWKNHFYQIIGKNSSDFTPIFYPPSDKNKKKLFCYELIEAGLCRILVFDERLCANLFDDQEQNKEITKVGSYLIYSRNNTGYIYQPENQWHISATGRIFLGEKFLDKTVLNNPTSNERNFTCELLKGKNNNLTLNIKYKQVEITDPLDCLIIHRTYLGSLKEDEQENFINMLKQIVPFIIVISGGGVVYGLKGFYKFKPFSTFNRFFTHQFSKYQIVRYSLT